MEDACVEGLVEVRIGMGIGMGGMTWKKWNSGKVWMCGKRTEEETFPDFEEFEFCEGSAGVEVDLERGEGFFADWAVCENGISEEALGVFLRAGDFWI